MTVAAATFRKEPWLRDRNWDLKRISLSVVRVAAPYLGYLAIIGLQ